MRYFAVLAMLLSSVALAEKEDNNGLFSAPSKARPANFTQVIYSAGICARRVLVAREKKRAAAIIAAVAKLHDRSDGARALDSADAWRKQHAWEVAELKRRAREEKIKLLPCSDKTVAAVVKCYTTNSFGEAFEEDCLDDLAAPYQAGARDVMQIDPEIPEEE